LLTYPASMPEPTQPLEVLTRLAPAGPGRFRADFPDGWQQGRGLFGGLVTCALVRAATTAAPERALRSLTAELCGPTQPGPAELQVEVLRAGSRVTTVAVRLAQGGEVQAHGVAVLGAARPGSAPSQQLAPPVLGDWRAVEPLLELGPLGPAFARYLEFRPEVLPFSGGSRAEARGWVRFRTPPELAGPAFLAAGIDTYWPAEFATATTLRPMATVAFTFQPLGELAGLEADAPLYFRSTLQAAAEGYGVEFRELWGHDGRLLALNQQTMCSI
jgi:Thioesterase-like superfamily